MCSGANNSNLVKQTYRRHWGVFKNINFILSVRAITFSYNGASIQIKELDLDLSTELYRKQVGNLLHRSAYSMKWKIIKHSPTT